MCPIAYRFSLLKKYFLPHPFSAKKLDRNIKRATKVYNVTRRGNDEKSLGNGQLGGHLFLIASQEVGSWAFHGNLGYIRNENKVDQRRDIWHASFAATWEVVKNLKLAADIGIERNPDNDANNDPAYLIAGVIYSVNEKFDVDFGVKCGLTKSEIDFSLMAGVTLRF
jgi:hypothetical protein